MQNSYLGSALAFLLLSSTSALAQEVASTELPELSVQGASAGSLTVPSIAAQRATVNATVGSVAFVDAKDFQNRYATRYAMFSKIRPVSLCSSVMVRKCAFPCADRASRAVFTSAASSCFRTDFR